MADFLYRYPMYLLTQPNSCKSVHFLTYFYPFPSPSQHEIDIFLFGLIRVCSVQIKVDQKTKYLLRDVLMGTAGSIM